MVRNSNILNSWLRRRLSRYLAQQTVHDDSDWYSHHSFTVAGQFDRAADFNFRPRLSLKYHRNIHIQIFKPQFNLYICGLLSTQTMLFYLISVSSLCTSNGSLHLFVRADLQFVVNLYSTQHLSPLPGCYNQYNISSVCFYLSHCVTQLILYELKEAIWHIPANTFRHAACY